jgi:hypothetical protein
LDPGTGEARRWLFLGGGKVGMTIAMERCDWEALQTLIAGQAQIAVVREGTTRDQGFVVDCPAACPVVRSARAAMACNQRQTRVTTREFTGALRRAGARC